MKLIVSIDKENYKRIKDDVYDTHDIHRAIISIRRGTPFDDMLNKIRAEIEQRPYGIANDSVIQGMKCERTEILDIIDKYKAESEDKE